MGTGLIIDIEVEVFSAGCYVCEKVVSQINELACPNCEVIVYDLKEKCETNVCENKAKAYGVKSLPAVAIDGELVDCCKNRAPVCSLQRQHLYIAIPSLVSLLANLLFG